MDGIANHRYDNIVKVSLIPSLLKGCQIPLNPPFPKGEVFLIYSVRFKE